MWGPCCRPKRLPLRIRGALGRTLDPCLAELRSVWPLMIRAATESDIHALHTLVLELARYERLEHEVLATPADLREHLFGVRPYAEALVAEDEGTVVGFALFFHNYSTFVGRPGLYLEDLFVLPEHRKKGHGLSLLRALARIAVERRCGRLEWSVLNWNEP